MTKKKQQIAIVNKPVELSITPESVELIKNTVAVGATNDELALFLHQAKKSGLDPLARQIYFVKRGGKTTIQTSIDGFRVVAERSGQYAGQDEPEFAKEGTDLFCKVRVYKWHNDQRYQAAVGVAYWKEYCPAKGQDFMWVKMPHVMLAKVAEALALRKAFPQDLSGLYTTEEMEQVVDVTEAKPKTVAVEKKATIEGQATQPSAGGTRKESEVPAETGTVEKCPHCGTTGKYHSPKCPQYINPQ